MPIGKRLMSVAAVLVVMVVEPSTQVPLSPLSLEDTVFVNAVDVAVATVAVVEANSSSSLTLEGQIVDATVTAVAAAIVVFAAAVVAAAVVAAAVVAAVAAAAAVVSAHLTHMSNS
jgi:hypothetical protein